MTEQPPAAVTEDLDRLLTALTALIPAKSGSNLLVGTWNIRALGDLTAKWAAGTKDPPKRDWHAVACLAAVISRFDVVAVQESRRNPAALKRLLDSLGPDWRVIISDVTEGAAGNGERLAYLYDSARVQPSGLAGEIVAYGQRAGTFGFVPHVLSGLTRSEVSRRISDHYPLWCEFLLA